MRKILLLLSLIPLLTLAQGTTPLEQLKSEPRKAYGTDYPYPMKEVRLTPAPRGYKPFYISHYGRHGSRYYWNNHLYKELDTLLTEAHTKHLLTADGEVFYSKFLDAKYDMITKCTELSDLGWEQHQYIARTMYNNFRDVFRHGGNVLAISSLSGRCVISMASFCEELKQCNPNIEIREQSSRSTLDGVVPDDKQNPLKKDFAEQRPRFENNRNLFHNNDSLPQTIIRRVFTTTEGLPGDMRQISGNLINLYTSLPSIGHEGMMGNIISDEEIAARWENENLGTYTWLFTSRNKMSPIVRDILTKAEDVISGKSTRIADLRFGHDACLGPVTLLLGVNGSDLDPEDPYKVKDCYQNWMTCKASNLQFVFYRDKRGQDILVKCLLNGSEASLPLQTDNYPYYKWQDFRKFCLDRLAQAQKNIIEN